MARLGLASLTLDSAYLDSTLLLHSSACFGPAMLLFGSGRSGFSPLILDCATLGFSLSLHSCAHLEPGSLVLDFLHLGSAPSVRAPAESGSLAETQCVCENTPHQWGDSHGFLGYSWATIRYFLDILGRIRYPCFAVMIVTIFLAERILPESSIYFWVVVACR